MSHDNDDKFEFGEDAAVDVDGAGSATPRKETLKGHPASAAAFSAAMSDGGGDEEDDPAERTVAFSLEDLGLAVGEEPAGGGTDAPDAIDPAATMAMDLNALGAAQPAEMDSDSAKTMAMESAGIVKAVQAVAEKGPVPGETDLVESTVAMDLATIAQQAANVGAASPGGPPPLPPGLQKPAIDSGAEMPPEEKTMVAEFPAFDEPEEKTMVAESPVFEELAEKTMVVASPVFDEPEEKTMVAESPVFDEPEEKTMVAESPVLEEPGERTRVESSPLSPVDNAGALPNMPVGDATMMFDASALLDARADSRPHGVVTIVEGNDSGKEFFLRADSTTVGRGLDCDLVLNDPSVSRRHFRLDREAEAYRMVDLGSGNGSLVDGVRVREIVLSESMRIEVGTTTLLFGYVGSEERAPVDVQVEVKKAGAGLRVFAALLLLLSLVGGGIALSESQGWTSLFGSDSSSASTSAAVESGSDEPTPAELAIDRVREHLAKQELQAANTALEEAVTHDANEELVERLRYQLREAGEHLKLVNQQKSLIPDQSTPEHASAARGVLRALAAIPATSPFYTDAARVTDRAKLQLIDIWLKQAYVMAGEGDAAGARSYAQKVIDLELAYCQQREGCDEEEATNAEAVAVLDDLNEEVALADTPSSDTPSADTPSSDTPSADTPSSDTPSSDTPSSDTPSSDTPSVERPRRRPRPEYERANFRQGYRFYGRKRFDQAITHFQRIARGNKYRRRDRRRASSMVDKIQSFKRLYGQANAAVAAYQPTTAIRLLDQARTLDRQINGAFGGEIRRNLSSMYAYRAAGAYTSRRYREAARFARKALNYNPGESSARLIYERVDAKVEALLAQARSAVNSGASQRARGLLNQVLGIVSQTDPRYRTATSLLNSLMIDQAEEDDD